MFDCTREDFYRLEPMLTRKCVMHIKPGDIVMYSEYEPALALVFANVPVTFSFPIKTSLQGHKLGMIANGTIFYHSFDEKYEILTFRRASRRKCK